MGEMNQSITRGQKQSMLQCILAELVAGSEMQGQEIGLYIFGTGQGGQSVVKHLEQCHGNIVRHIVKGFFDNNSSRQGTRQDGILVTAPRKELIGLDDFVIIASLTHCNEMEKQLLQMGIDKEKIILPFGWLRGIFTDVLQYNEEERRQAESYAKELQVVSDIHTDDFIFRFVYDNPGFQTKKDAIKAYFYDGDRSANKLYDILFSYLELKQDISFLEFASGYGCMTRHLVNKLDKDKFVSCDIHEDAIQFISEKLKAKALISTQIPEELCVGSYDVVFALSFFSHMPKISWSRWFSALLKQTKQAGFLIFTTHGELSNHHLHGTFDSDGFYFQADSEQMDIDPTVYGTTATTFEFVSNVIAANDCRLKMYAEGYWWGHQDLYIIQRC